MAQKIQIDFIVKVKNEPLLEGIRFRVIDVCYTERMARIARIRDTSNSIKRSKKVVDRYDKHFEDLEVLKVNNKVVEEEKHIVDLGSFEL